LQRYYPLRPKIPKDWQAIKEKRIEDIVALVHKQKEIKRYDIQKILKIGDGTFERTMPCILQQPYRIIYDKQSKSYKSMLDEIAIIEIKQDWESEL